MKILGHWINVAILLLPNVIPDSNALPAQVHLNIYPPDLRQQSVLHGASGQIRSETDAAMLWTDSLMDLDAVVFSEHWDTRRINVYKNIPITYPFQIGFSKGTITRPVKGELVVTSRFGRRSGELHRGIDIDLRTGDEVLSILDGKVRFVGYNAGHGNAVVVRHPNGLETVYAHLSRFMVEENEVVKEGQLLGKGGKTGNARGSHLHFEVRYLGRTVNPEYFFDFKDGMQLRADSLWVAAKITEPRRYSSLRTGEMQVVTTNQFKQEGSTKINIVSTNVADEKKLLSAAGAAAVHESDTDRQDFYVIQYGDTIYSLARKHGVKIEALCLANGIQDSFKIRVGQRLTLNF